eukprot:2642081-Rhodomonas_salina.3
MPYTDPQQAAIGLRACYAMSGTHIAYQAKVRVQAYSTDIAVVFTRDMGHWAYGSIPAGTARYAMSGSDIAQGPIGLHCRYAMSGTEIAYDTEVYLPARYAMPGTHTADGSIGILL